MPRTELEAFSTGTPWWTAHPGSRVRSHYSICSLPCPPHRLFSFLEFFFCHLNARTLSSLEVILGMVLANCPPFTGSSSESCPCPQNTLEDGGLEDGSQALMVTWSRDLEHILPSNWVQFIDCLSRLPFKCAPDMCSLVRPIVFHR